MFKPQLSGRAAVVTLSVAAAMIAGGALFGATAKAQSSPNPTMDAQFGPTMLGPTDANGGGDTHALIGLLLPAVRQVKQPFSVQILNDDTNLVIPIQASGDGRTSAFVDVSIVTDATGQRQLKAALMGSAEYRQATNYSNVTIRILPAVQSNGRIFQPMSSSDIVKGYTRVTMGDGSVVPIPFVSDLAADQVAQGR